MLSPVVIAAAGTVLLLTVALHSHGSSPVPAPHCHNTVTGNLLKTDPAQQLFLSRDAKQQSHNSPASYCLLAGEQQPTER